MSEPTDFERQREGAMILIDSDEVKYFQVFAGTNDGPITLSGTRETADADYGLFLGQMMRILANSNNCSVDEIAEWGIEQAGRLEAGESNP